MDANLLHISYEGKILEDPWSSPPEDMWRWTSSPKNAPNEAEELVIEFFEGDPVSINDKRMSSFSYRLWKQDHLQRILLLILLLRLEHFWAKMSISTYLRVEKTMDLLIFFLHKIYVGDLHPSNKVVYFFYLHLLEYYLTQHTTRALVVCCVK